MILEINEQNNVDILYEDNHVIVVNKPAGILSQKDKTNDDSILEIVKDYIKITYNKPGNVFLGLVHRLDRPTSGVMVFARTSKALTRLTVSLKAKEFDKKYYAILDGKMNIKSGELIHYLVKDNIHNVVKAYPKPVNNSKKAELKFNLIGVIEDLSLVNIHLITGRSHQIRSQFSKAFYPVAGDFKYGSRTKIKDRSICLHCHSLSFIHPVKKERMVFTSMPDYDKCLWKKFIKILG